MPADGTLFGPRDQLRIAVLFAGIGGSCIGIQRATGHSPMVAINHWPYAIRTHAKNHPETLHFEEDVWNISPQRGARGLPLDALWASPDCTHFSKAKGARPLSSGRRSLAWVVVDWAREVKPGIIFLENVQEIQTWGPLYPDDHPVESLRGRPIPERKGECWRAWLLALEAEGYRIEWRILVAADYGAPTSRERLYLIARRDGQPIVWPKPTHGHGLIPWRTAAECIDWSVPACSIFASHKEAKIWAKANKRPGIPQRPLEFKTQVRVAEGFRRHVLKGEPFLAPMRSMGEDRRFELAAWFTKFYGTSTGASLTQPGPVITAGGGHIGLTVAWVAKHYGGVVGHGLEQPIGTITRVDHHSLCAASLLCLTHGGRLEPINEPARTITTANRGERAVQVAFLSKFYGEGGISQGLDRPLDTITTLARFGLVTVNICGETYVVTDIGLRMLTPWELKRMQGFPDDFEMDGTIADQIEGIGNSVCPQMAEAIVRANVRAA